MQAPLQDALLNRFVRVTIVGTIALIALAGLILCYRALFELMGANLPTAGRNMGWGAVCVTAALLLIRYRGDLVDD